MSKLSIRSLYYIRSLEFQCLTLHCNNCSCARAGKVRRMLTISTRGQLMSTIFFAIFCCRSKLPLFNWCVAIFRVCDDKALSEGSAASKSHRPPFLPAVIWVLGYDFWPLMSKCCQDKTRKAEETCKSGEFSSKCSAPLAFFPSISGTHGSWSPS